LVNPEVALWHDHTGTLQTTLSIGMAGKLHLAPPPAVQIEATVRLVRWLMAEYDISVDQVCGHTDRARRVRTVCPGWDSANWRNDFYRALEARRD
jgi:N-acetyl-anhydromuramyl-L-alanine amidase AmpD